MDEDTKDLLMNYLGEQNLPYKRDFTTGNDMIALKDKIVETGEFDAFENYACRQWAGSEDEGNNFTNWLLDPTRFCELCASWWQERKVKG